MSGSGGTVQAVPFGVSAFGLPYAVFNATSFRGWNNTSGTGGAGGNMPVASGSPSFSNQVVQSDISPQLLSAQQDALQSTINTGLGNLSASGVFNFSGAIAAFSSWFSNIASVNTSAANSLNTAVNKSAKAGGGLFGSIF